MQPHDVLSRRAKRTSLVLANVLCALCTVVAAPTARAVDTSASANPANDLPLTDLPDLPAVKKKTPKPKVKKKEENAQVDDATGGLVAAPPTQSSLPPPTRLPDVPGLTLSTHFGVTLVRSQLLDEATTADIESGMRGIAFQAPMSQYPMVLRATPEAACAADDDPCFIAKGAKEGADTVIVAVAERSAAGITMHLRELSIFGRRRVSEKQIESPDERISLKAATEGLLCKMIVPAGCTNELLIDVGRADLLYDGRVLPKGNTVPMRLALPVGLAPLSAREGGRTGPTRLVPVLREKMTGVALTVRPDGDGLPALATLSELDHPPAPSAATIAQAAHRRALVGKVAGFGVAGAGVVVLAAGFIEGLHAHSLLSQSQSAYDSHPGAWASSELSTLHNGNSAARTANILFIAGGIAAAAGLTFALTF